MIALFLCVTVQIRNPAHPAACSTHVGRTEYFSLTQQTHSACRVHHTSILHVVIIIILSNIQQHELSPSGSLVKRR